MVIFWRAGIKVYMGISRIKLGSARRIVLFSEASRANHGGAASKTKANKKSITPLEHRSLHVHERRRSSNPSRRNNPADPIASLRTILITAVAAAIF